MNVYKEMEETNLWLCLSPPAAAAAAAPGLAFLLSCSQRSDQGTICTHKFTAYTSTTYIYRESERGRERERSSLSSNGSLSPVPAGGRDLWESLLSPSISHTTSAPSLSLSLSLSLSSSVSTDSHGSHLSFISIHLHRAAPRKQEQKLSESSLSHHARTTFSPSEKTFIDLSVSALSLQSPQAKGKPSSSAQDVKRNRTQKRSPTNHLRPVPFLCFRVVSRRDDGAE
jgi:hypothetical protein